MPIIIIYTYTLFQVFIAPIFVFMIGANSHYNAIDYTPLNPIQLFKMTRLNRFGAWSIAVICWIAFMPWAIGYWIYKAFTVGG